MNVLIVNIGSTSLKFRLFDMSDESVRVVGTIEGVGRGDTRIMLHWHGEEPRTDTQSVADQGAAVRFCLQSLRDKHALDVDAIGFKAVHGGHIGDAVRITPDVIATMEQFAAAAPAHNPAYIAAMRAFEQEMPDTPLVAAFETGFHQTIPAARSVYAIPYEWTQDCGVRRYGFHGASHRYIAARTAELFNRDDLRVVSCHLGGSSSICAIRNGRSVATSFGMTPQSGVPQNNRVGEFDAYALLPLRERTGLDMDALLDRMARAGGLLGISGVSNDMPEILAAARDGNQRALLARDAFVESVRHYIGAYIVALEGLDVLAFTGGIGQRSAEIRERICAGLGFLGIEIDARRNAQAENETNVAADGARVAVLTLQTNEELIVARQTAAVLNR